MPSLMRFLTAIATMAGLGYASLYALATFVQPRPRVMSEPIPSARLRPQPPAEAAAVRNPKTAGAEAGVAGTSATP